MEISRLLVITAVLISSALTYPTTEWQDLQIVPRVEWHARPPKLVEPMKNPVPFVVIHHSYQPAACNTSSECIKAMQWMQNFHQDDRGWNDIGYSFAVGGDGLAYTGRGWSAVGAHAPKYNNRSIGICVIGDWRFELPPKNQLSTVHNLIDYGVHMGYIQKDYHLVGHRQVRNTECPGDRLYHEIQTWDHYCLNPDQCTENNIPTYGDGHGSGYYGSSSSPKFLVWYIWVYIILTLMLVSQ